MNTNNLPIPMTANDLRNIFICYVSAGKHFNTCLTPAQVKTFLAAIPTRSREEVADIVLLGRCLDLPLKGDQSKTVAQRTQEAIAHADATAHCA